MQSISIDGQISRIINLQSLSLFLSSIYNSFLLAQRLELLLESDISLDSTSDPAFPQSLFLSLSLLSIQDSYGKAFRI